MQGEGVESGQVHAPLSLRQGARNSRFTNREVRRSRHPLTPRYCSRNSFFWFVNRPSRTLKKQKNSPNTRGRVVGRVSNAEKTDNHSMEVIKSLYFFWTILVGSFPEILFLNNPSISSSERKRMTFRGTTLL